MSEETVNVSGKASDLEITKMHEDFRSKVFSDCKILYSLANDDKAISCMSRGWENGYGWDHILADLSYELEGMNILQLRDRGIEIVAQQVKEKFGTLRFYFSICASNDNEETQVIVKSVEAKVNRLIANAEHKCYNTCEECGSRIGTEQSPRCTTQGYVRNLCKECYDKFHKNRV